MSARGPRNAPVEGAHRRDGYRHEPWIGAHSATSVRTSSASSTHWSTPSEVPMRDVLPRATSAYARTGVISPQLQPAQIDGGARVSPTAGWGHATRSGGPARRTRDRSRSYAQRRPAPTGIRTALDGGYTTRTGSYRGAGDRGVRASHLPPSCCTVTGAYSGRAQGSGTRIDREESIQAFEWFCNTAPSATSSRSPGSPARHPCAVVSRLGS